MEIILREGKNREIRRILARLGHKVQTLRRIAVGPLKLGDLPHGAYRILTAKEVDKLWHAIELAEEESTDNSNKRPRGAKKRAGKKSQVKGRGIKQRGSNTPKKRPSVRPTNPRGTRSTFLPGVTESNTKGTVIGGDEDSNTSGKTSRRSSKKRSSAKRVSKKRSTSNARTSKKRSSRASQKNNSSSKRGPKKRRNS